MQSSTESATRISRNARIDSALQRVMRPRSVAIVGMSAKPGSVGHQVLRNLTSNGFDGEIHLIGRSAGEIEGLEIKTDIALLPEGVDVVVLSLPAAAVSEAIQSCIARKANAAVVFASGFAELGDEARAEQERLGRLAEAGGLSVIGPNCLGYTNFVTGFIIGFVNVIQVPRMKPGTRDAVAIVGQSGGVQGHLYQGLVARGVAVSYSIATGNEMDLGLGDFVRFLVADEATRVVTVYAEHIGDPAGFIEAARAARQQGKPIVLLHPGRSAKAQEAAKSHTGSLAGNHAVMRVTLEREGVVVVDTLDELLDVSELLARYPRPVAGGLGIMTFSGAFCGIAHDFCSDLGVDVPALSPEVEAVLRPQVPSFIPPRNPLDLGTQPLFQHELVEIGLRGLLSEPAIGGVVISIPPSNAVNANAFLAHVIKARDESDKPVGLSILNDTQPLPDDFMRTVHEQKIVLSRSSDRTIRAMAKLIARAAVPETVDRIALRPYADMPELGAGTMVEWRGKQVLAAAGIPIPAGSLATSVDEAVTVAERIGYPVVLKAQAGSLAHKTEAGGVLLNIADADSLRRNWAVLTGNIERAQPGLVLDGVLVEKMSARGLELVVGATRDPQWGPMILVGLGGVLVEALGDVRLLPPDASEAEILGELGKLKTARLLHGFRGAPAVDLPAIARVVRAVGRLMATQPEITEIDVNPLMVYADGQGAMALDALVVTRSID